MDQNNYGPGRGGGLFFFFFWPIFFDPFFPPKHGNNYPTSFIVGIRRFIVFVYPIFPIVVSGGGKALKACVVCFLLQPKYLNLF